VFRYLVTYFPVSANESCVSACMRAYVRACV